MGNLFNTYIYNPLFHVLVFIYQNLSFHDLGIAIILLTIFVRLVLLPLFYKGAKDQAIMQKIAPKLREIQLKHKNDKEKLVQATMELYKEHKVSPFSSFLLILIQFPILIALIKLVRSINMIPNVNPIFLGIVDLTQKNFILVILAAVIQYFSSKLLIPKSNKSFKNLSPQEKMSRQMVLFSPLLTILVLWFWPAAAALYWLTFSVFSVIQQIIINKRLNINEEIKEEEKHLDKH